METPSPKAENKPEVVDYGFEVDHAPRRGREREEQSQEALVEELRVRLDSAEIIDQLKSRKIAELTKKLEEKQHDNDKVVGEGAAHLVNLLGREHAQLALAEHKCQTLEEELRKSLEANRKLMERLIEQKKADRLRAQEVEQLSQKLLSLQKWKVKETKKRMSATKAAAKPILIEQAFHTEITEPRQESRETADCQSACETDHDLHDDEPERVRAQRPASQRATSEPASHRATSEPASMRAVEPEKPMTTWPDTEDEYE